MPIYLDHGATTPMREEVLARMLPFLREDFGNASSPHAVGRRARAALDEAHETVARAIGGEPREVVFTGGGTEAVNLAVKGAAWAGKAMGHRIITSAVEHRAVLESCRHLEKFGFELIVLPVDRYGRVDPDALGGALTERTVLVSLQVANNEVGTVGPVGDLVPRVRRIAPRALVHLDAIAAAHHDVDVRALGADLVTFAAHKLEGPKGVGVLWLRRGTAILPQLHGGSQERYRRAGTEDVAGAVGAACAFELAAAERDATAIEVRRRRDTLRDAITRVDAVEVTGHPRDRLPGHLSVVVRDVDGAALVNALDLAGICASTGSACTTGSAEPSLVLTAMGFPDEEARGALRLTLGRTTTDEDVAAVAGALPGLVERLREGARAQAADPLGHGIEA
jgi:cysteine desulfurase